MSIKFGIGRVVRGSVRTEGSEESGKLAGEVEEAVGKRARSEVRCWVKERAAGRRAMRSFVAVAGLLSVSSSLVPAEATADIDVENIEFFKGLDRFSGVIPANSAYFVELCLVATDVTSAIVTPPSPGQPCPMDDFVLGDEFCCEQSFDTLLELDTAFPTGPGQNYTVDIVGVGGPASAVVEFDVETPLAFTDITSPAPGATFDTDLDLPVTWTLTRLPACPVGPTTDCADGIALFVSPTMGMDDDVYNSDNDPILITDTSRDVPNAVLEPNTEYRIEVETFNGTQDVPMSTDLKDSYLLSRIYEDINSIVVPEPSVGWSQAVALALLLGVARSRHRRR